MVMPTRSLTAVALVLTLTVGCATPATIKQATLPRPSPDLDEREFYEQYKLDYRSGFLSQSWQRRDGEYTWLALEALAGAYPQTKDLRARANRRGGVLGALAGLGGGIAGYTFGWNIAANDERRMSSDTQKALYATAGGLILLTIVIAAAWHNPADDFADAYNENLARELGVSAQHARSGSSPRVTLAPAGLGLAF